MWHSFFFFFYFSVFSCDFLCNFLLEILFFDFSIDTKIKTMIIITKLIIQCSLLVMWNDRKRGALESCENCVSNYTEKVHVVERKMWNEINKAEESPSTVGVNFLSQFLPPSSSSSSRILRWLNFFDKFFLTQFLINFPPSLSHSLNALRYVSVL